MESWPKKRTVGVTTPTDNWDWAPVPPHLPSHLWAFRSPMAGQPLRLKPARVVKALVGCVRIQVLLLSSVGAIVHKVR